MLPFCSQAFDCLHSFCFRKLVLCLDTNMFASAGSKDYDDRHNSGQKRHHDTATVSSSPVREYCIGSHIRHRHNVNADCHFLSAMSVSAYSSAHPCLLYTVLQASVCVISFLQILAVKSLPSPSSNHSHMFRKSAVQTSLQHSIQLNSVRVRLAVGTCSCLVLHKQCFIPPSDSA